MTKYGLIFNQGAPIKASPHKITKKHDLLFLIIYLKIKLS